MNLTLSYDLRLPDGLDGNVRNYIRSALERFGWSRLGGSVFRYPAPGRLPDLLNDIVPSLAFFRAYTLKHQIKVRFLTLDAIGALTIDNSEPDAPFGSQSLDGPNLGLADPTNVQSSEQALRNSLTH